METNQAPIDSPVKYVDQTFNKKDIKNIIFDFGGVLLHIDFKKTHKAFEDLGIKDPAGYFSQHHASELFSLLETGHISNEAFYDLFRKEAENPLLTDEQIRDGWNAMLLHYAKENIALLKRLSGTYKLYLFSNTNQIHYDWFADLYQKEFNGQRLEDLFTVAWFSHEKGVRKPAAGVFTHMLEVEGLKAAETLFIDDTISNIEGAAKAGLKTHLLKSPAELLLLDL
jgi:putative hydrolase of the HAD superfamily